MTAPNVFDRLADLYEQVTAMPATTEATTGRATGKPGSRVPPGLSVILDEDERRRAVASCDQYAEMVTRMLTDTTPGIGSVPDDTPARLRLISGWAEELQQLEPIFWYTVFAQAEERHTELKHLAKRGTRQVRTGSPCLDITCSGQYIATLDGPEADSDITCDRCHSTVPATSWQRWGRTRTDPDEWVTADKARTLLGLRTVQGVYMRAKRQKWRRRGGKGRDNVRFHRGDVMRGATGGTVA